MTNPTFSWCFHEHMSVCQRLDRSCVTGTWQLSRTSAVIPPTLLHVVTQRLLAYLSCPQPFQLQGHASQAPPH